MMQQPAHDVIRLVLPYPISANKYWRSAIVCGRAQTYVSKEAKEFKERVGWLCRAAGIRKPLPGRVALRIELYPNRPQDYRTRQRKHGAAWDDDVLCMDLDNANKVLLDALKGVAIEDDKWVRKLSSERMEPDEHGARVVLRIEPIAVEQPQEALL